MSSTPPNKRPRTVEPAPSPAAAEPVRDGEFWFTDGSIVLLAGGVAFRIYHGVLANASVVFHDMLQLPQPPSSPSLDGCPTLELSDSPIDLRYLLRVLFPKPVLRAKTTENAPVEFEYISALVRLSHKYQMDDILKDALSYLTEYYTNDYEKWLKRDQTPLQVKSIHAIEAVALARLTGTLTMLPTALLVCATEVKEKIFDGYRREDGTLVTLAHEDLRRCFLGYRRLRSQDATSLHGLAALIGNRETRGGLGCRYPQACKDVMSAFETRAYAGRTPPKDILRPWAEQLSRFKAPLGIGICGSCETEVLCAGAQFMGRLGSWSCLPKIFDVIVPQWLATECNIEVPPPP